MSGNPLLNMMGGNNPMAAMMNSPIMGLVNMFRNGGNPMPFVQQMKSQNREFGEAIDAINGKSQDEFNDFLAQKAKEKGVDLRQFAGQIGMPTEIQKKFNIG